jgi:putative flippase GtrA
MKLMAIQDVSKIHGITSGISSSYVDNKTNLYQHRSENASVLVG